MPQFLHSSSMDSLPLQPSKYDPLFPSRRRSTSQICLHKILTVIATVPPPFLVPETEKSLADRGAKCVNKRSRLNTPEQKKSLSSSSSGGGVSDSIDLAENVASGNPRVEIEEAERSLTLLIEAAQLILGEFVDGEKSDRNRFALKYDDGAVDFERSRGEVVRRSSCWTAAEIGGEFEESSPVARLKREELGFFRADTATRCLNRLSGSREPIRPLFRPSADGDK